HQCHAERSKGVAQRCPLRHGGHCHFPERHANDCSEHQGDENPLVFHNAVVQQSSRNRQQHSQLTGKNASSRGRRRAQPLEGQNEKSRGNQIGNFNDMLQARKIGHGFFGPLALNILSIRSVMRNPPTMLLVAATIATVPKTFASIAPRAWYSPARRMAPTTAMASSAFVSDISGVCSSGETRRITSKPMNAASMNTYRLVSRSIFISLLPPSVSGGAASRSPAVWELPLPLPVSPACHE